MAKACGKTCYATKVQAEAMIASMAKKYRFTFKKAYRCGNCKAWHITSKPPPKGRRKKW